MFPTPAPISASKMAMLQIELSVQRMVMDFQTTITHFDPDESNRRTREFQEVQMANLDHNLMQSCMFVKAHIITAQRTLNRMQRNSIMVAAEDLFGHEVVAKRIQGHQNLIKSRRAHFQRLGDFTIKRTNDWQRVVNQDVDARSEMVVRLITEYRFLLRSQSATEYDIAKESGAPRDVADRLSALAR